MSAPTECEADSHVFCESMFGGIACDVCGARPTEQERADYDEAMRANVRVTITKRWRGMIDEKRTAGLETIAHVCESVYLAKPPEVAVTPPAMRFDHAYGRTMAIPGSEDVTITLTLRMDGREFDALRRGSEAIARLVEDCAPSPGCLARRRR